MIPLMVCSSLCHHGHSGFNLCRVLSWDFHFPFHRCFWKGQHLYLVLFSCGESKPISGYTCTSAYHNSFAIFQTGSFNPWVYHSLVWRMSPIVIRVYSSLVWGIPNLLLLAFLLALFAYTSVRIFMIVAVVALSGLKPFCFSLWVNTWELCLLSRYLARYPGSGRWYFNLHCHLHPCDGSSHSRWPSYPVEDSAGLSGVPTTCSNPCIF
jgi:hypothetical protein